MQYVFRFMVGGLIVSVFAALGDVLKPKSFAGLFGAAPSVALATLGLTAVRDGKLYAAQESHSMIIGAIALFVYACVTTQLIFRYKWHAGRAAIYAITVWLIFAVGMWLVALR